MRPDRLYRATALMSAGTALSRVTGLARVAAMTFALGVAGTRLADAYNLANTTPNIIFELFLGGVFTSVFVPVMVQMRDKKRGDSNSLISTSLLALAIVSAVTLVAAPLVIRIYTFRIVDPVARQQTQELASFLLRWFAPQIFFYGMSAIAEAVLNIEGRFGPPKFVPILNNVVWGGTFLLYAFVIGQSDLPLSAGARTLLGAGTTLGVVIQAAALLPFMRGMKFKFRPSFRDPAVKAVMRLSGYVVGYVFINQVGLWFIYALATRTQGGVTAYQVAFAFMLLPHSLFAVSLNSALVPQLSNAAVAEDHDSYRHSFALGVRGIVYLVTPAAIGYAILARPVAIVLLARGATTLADANLIAGVLQMFALGLVFFSLFQFLTRCFYARHNTRTPTALNAIAVAITSILNIGLYSLYGVKGLAIGHAVGYAFGTIGLGIALNRLVPGGLDLRSVGRGVSKMMIAAAAMGTGVWFLAQLPIPPLLRVLASVLGGAIIYFAFSLVMDIPERRILIGGIPRPASRPTRNDREDL